MVARAWRMAHYDESTMRKPGLESQSGVGLVGWSISVLVSKLIGNKTCRGVPRFY